MMKNVSAESGVALISALALLATLSLLIASAVVLTQYSSAEVNTFDLLNRSYYYAESAANRAILLLAQDRARNLNRNPEHPQSDDTERFMADNRIHKLEIYTIPIQLQISDALGGIDVSGTTPSRQLSVATASEEQKKELTVLANRLDDYVDMDELIRIDGMERGDYRQAGLPELPRNRPLQFREELRFIPGFTSYYPVSPEGRLDTFRLIAPAKLKTLAGRPNLYSTPLSQIIERCRLNPSEIELLYSAFQSWITTGKALKESLPLELYGKLTAAFATLESGTYTISVNTAAQENPGVRLTVTLFGDFTAVKVEYGEYVFF